MPAYSRLLLIVFICLSLSAGWARAENLRLVRSQPALAAPDPVAESKGLLPAGLVVDAQKRQGHWVRVRSDTLEGWVRVQALARLEGDSSAWSAILGFFKPNTGLAEGQGDQSPARVAPPSRAAAHALILTIADYGQVAPALPGVNRDIDSAVLMARLLGVPEEQTIALADGRLGLAGLRAALDDLEAKLLPNDEVFLYFSGYGSQQRLADGRCGGALLAADGQSLGDAELAQRLRRLADRTARLLVFLDVGSGMTALLTRPERLAKYQPAAAAPCEPAPGELSHPLARSEGVGGNLLLISPAGGEVARDDVRRGGLATRAWLDCLAGSAQDLDRSGGLSAAEVGLCAQPLAEAMAAPAGLQSYWRLAGNAARVLRPADGPRPEPSALLADLYASRDERRRVTLTSDRQPYRINPDHLSLSVTSSQPGYLYLLRADAAGKGLELLFPNPRDEANYLPVGVSLTLPRPWWAIQPGGPSGQDRLLALVSDAPRNFARLGMQSGRHSLFLPAAAEQMEWVQTVATTSANTGQPACRQSGKRNIASECSDAYGAALAPIEEAP